MSNVPAVQDQAPAPVKVEDSASDLQFRQLLRRLQVMAPNLARMPGLNKSLVVSTGSGSNRVIDKEATLANVEAVGFTLATYGIALNATNVQQFDVIQGTLTPRCQLQMGIVTELTGHAISLAPFSDEYSATAVLVRADNGERHESTYTVEQARESGALDFWVERWANGRPAERIVLGYTEAEARAAQAAHPQAWVKGESIKSLEAWHKYRADMLARRALKRVMRWGAPEVVSGVVTLRERYHAQAPPAIAAVKVDMGLDDSDGPAGIGPGTAGPKYEFAEAPGEVPPSWAAPVKAFGRRIIRLNRQIEALPEDWRRPLSLAWEAKRLPALEGDDFMPHHLDEAEAIVDRITAEALRQQAPAVTVTQTGQGAEAAGGTGHAPIAGVQPERGEAHGPDHTVTSPQRSQARNGEEGRTSRGPDVDSAPAGPPTNEPARPLPQQIAMQAREGGIDWHQVIAAVTGGAKTSSKTLDAEEGELVIKAIADLRAGTVVLVEKPDGWHFASPTAGQATFDQGAPFD